MNDIIDVEATEVKAEEQTTQNSGENREKEFKWEWNATDGERVTVTKDKSQVFIGIIILVLAASLLTRKMGIFTGLSIWKIVIDLLLLNFLLKGIRHKNIGEIFLSGAFLIIANDKLLHLQAITPWPVLGAAILGAIGCEMIFPAFKKNGQGFKPLEKNRQVVEEKRNADHLFYKNNFGSSVKYVNGTFSDLKVENSFGETQLYFTDATLKDGSAEVKINCSFGNMVLYVPAEWNVKIRVTASFGNVAEKGKCDVNGTNILYIGGDVSFGNLDIKYV